MTFTSGCLLTSIIYQMQRKLIVWKKLYKFNSEPFPGFHNKMIAQRIPSCGCWKPTAVYGITDKICILGLLTTFPPADGGRKDVIHHLFTMGFIYSSVNSCPREWVIEFKWEGGSGLFASFQICLQGLVARSPFSALIMIHVLWSHSVNWVVRDCQKGLGVLFGTGRVVGIAACASWWLEQ